MQKPVQKYSQIRSVLDTGDVVLFSNPGLIAGVIQFATRSRWSHVGMIVRARVADDDEILLLWESTMMSPVKDVHTGKVLNGIQLVPLSVRLAVCQGTVAVRRLKRPLADWQRVNICRLRKNLRGRPYERDVGQLFKAAWDGWLGANVEDASSLFCSEAVALACRSMNLTPRGMISSELVPGDFSVEGNVTWVNEAYGEQIEVVWDPGLAEGRVETVEDESRTGENCNE